MRPFAWLLCAVYLCGVASAAVHDEPHGSHGNAGGTPDGYGKSTLRCALPDLDLVDLRGQPLPLADALGGDRPVLAATFRSVQDTLADRARLVSITIDPEHDTPEVLSAYASRFGAAPHWRFYTGRLPDVAAVQRAFGVYQFNKMRHEPAVFIRADSVWIKLEGFLSSDELLAEYRLLPNPQ